MLKITKYFFISIFSVVLLFSFFLFSGIKVSSISLGDGHKISQLYLKLDKKLILSIDKIELGDFKSSEDSEKLDNLRFLVYVNDALSFFNKIEIKNIIYNNDSYSLKYINKNLYLESKDLKLSLTYNLEKDKIVNKLNIKSEKFRLGISADITTLLDNMDSKISMNIKHENDFDIPINMIVKVKEEKFLFEIDSFDINSLNFINDFTTLDETAKEWIFQRISFSKIIFDKFTLRDDFDNLEKLAKNIDVKLDIKNFSIKYLDDAPKISAKNISVFFEKDKINLKLKDTYLKDINLDKSNISLENIFSENRVVKFDIKSDEFNDISFVKDMKVVPNVVKEWAIDRLKAKKYRLNSAKNTIFISNPIFDFNKLFVDLDSEDIEFNFNDKASNLLSNKLNTKIENGNIFFKLDKPSLENIELNGSSARLLDVFNEDISLEVDLICDDKIDNRILDVLKAYEIPIPISQTKGKSKVETTIKIPFKNISRLEVETKLQSNNSKFKIFNIEFDANKISMKFKDGIVKIDNSKVTLFENIILDDLLIDFYVQSLQLNLKSKVSDNNKIIDAKLTNSTNLKTMVSIGTIYVEDANYSKFLKISKMNIPYSLYLDKEIKAYLPTLQTFYTLDINGSHNILVEDLQKVYKYVPFFDEFSLSNGNVHLSTKDFNDFDIDTTISGFNLPVYYKNEQLNSIELNAKILNKEFIKIVSKSKDFKIDIDLRNSMVINGDINNIGFDFVVKDEENIEKVASMKKKVKENDKLSDIDLPMIFMKFENGFIGYNGKRVDFNTTVLETNKKNLNLSLHYNDVNASINKFGDNISFKFQKVNDIYLNNFIGKEILKDGYIDIQGYGEENNITGYVSLHETKIKNIAIVNHIMAFLNLINPLSTIQTTARIIGKGFDLNSYHTEEGLIKFNYFKDKGIVDIYSIYTHGSMSDFDAKLKLDLEEKTMKGDIKIIFMKDYSAIVGAVPILNYIMLGDDKEVSISADINGTFSEPIIETHVTKETTQVPLNILKRIIMLPAKAVELITPLDTNTTKEETTIE